MIFETGSRLPGDCPACGAKLLVRAHRPRCPRSPLARRPWEILRLAVTEQERRLEDLLQEATRKAWVASEKNGGRP